MGPEDGTRQGDGPGQGWWSSTLGAGRSVKRLQASVLALWFCSAWSSVRIYHSAASILQLYPQIPEGEGGVGWLVGWLVGSCMRIAISLSLPCLICLICQPMSSSQMQASSRCNVQLLVKSARCPTTAPASTVLQFQGFSGASMQASKGGFKCSGQRGASGGMTQQGWQVLYRASWRAVG